MQQRGPWHRQTPGAISLIATTILLASGLGTSAQLPPIIDMTTYTKHFAVFGIQGRHFLSYEVEMSGDFNGDGIADLVLGTSGATKPWGENQGHGAAYIIFGSSELPSTVDFPDGEGHVIIYGAQGGDFLTSKGGIAIGDFNNDGFDDLALGAPLADALEAPVVNPLSPRYISGKAYIVYGSENMPSIIDLENNNQVVTIYGAENHDRLTWDGLRVGDFNADGIDDLVLASSFARHPVHRSSYYGAAYLIYGSASIPAVIDLATFDADVTISGARSTYGGELLASGGVEVGDFNADGIDDLALGAYDMEGMIRPDGKTHGRGGAYLVFGSKSLPTWIDLNEGDADVKISGSGPGGKLTYSHAMSVLDFNGDGIDDLELGADRAGVSYIVFGSATLPSEYDIGISNGHVTIHGTAARYTFRYRAIGDFNNDGFDDFVAGGTLGNGPLGDREDAGESHLVYGSPDPPPEIDFTVGDEVVIIYGASAGDQCRPGQVADVNDDGIDDLVLSARLGDGPHDDRADDAGEVYVIYGGETLPRVVDLAAHDEDLFIYGNALSSASFKYLPDAVRDFNGDGVEDFILKGPGDVAYDDNGTRYSQAIYIMFGPSSPPLCETLLGIEPKLDALSAAFGIYEDFDEDGLPEIASLALIEAVACIYQEPMTQAVENAFEINSDIFRHEPMARRFLQYRDAITTLMMVGEDTQIALKEILADGGLFLTGDYVAVNCTAADLCMPARVPGADLLEAFEVPVAPQDIDELFGGDNDVDRDAVSNYEEYRNVMDRGGTIDDFAEFALDPTRDGTEFVGQASVGGGGGSGGSCLIATAAYGTPLEEDIDTLREFRDASLMTNRLGAAFVDTYYRLSPPFAQRIAESESLRAAVRAVLRPFVAVAERLDGHSDER